MGGALLSHWKDSDDQFAVVDPFLDQAPAGTDLVKDRAALGGRRFDTVVVAVKPQQIDEIVPDYRDAFADDGYLLSIAAGCSIERLTRASGNRPIVRVMPNLPAAIGRGVSGVHQ